MYFNLNILCSLCLHIIQHKFKLNFLLLVSLFVKENLNLKMYWHLFKRVPLDHNRLNFSIFFLMKLN